MKSFSVLLMVGFVTNFCNAQNVGIGPTPPLMPLHISKPTDTALLLLENQAALANNTSVGLYLKNGNRFTGGIRTIGSDAFRARLGFFTYASLSPGGLRESISIIDNGNVGIGITTPNEQLHIDSNMRLGLEQWTSSRNDRVIKFGNGANVSIGEAGADDQMQLKAANFYFTRTLGETRVGINKDNPLYNLDVTGSIRNTGNIITGGLSVGGNATVSGNLKIAGGTPGEGKVLTSDAEGNANWKPQAYGNTERFFLIKNTDGYNIDYNLGTAAINTISGGITIGKTGLYYLDIKFSVSSPQLADYSQTGSSPRTVNLILKKNGLDYRTLQQYVTFVKTPFASTPLVNYGYYASLSATTEIYLTAGSIISANINSFVSNLTFYGSIVGHLISE